MPARIGVSIDGQLCLVAGRFDVFAMENVELGNPPRWNRDPKTGIEAPLDFGKQLDYRDPSRVGDCKYLWEPNRHLHLVTLAQAYALTAQARYADALLAQMMQSVACNALHSIEARCSRWLLSTQDRVGQSVIPLTQEALAEMLGVQRTTVTAVAQALQARDLIRYARGRVEILNRQGIEKIACECYAAVEDHFEKLLPEVAEIGA